MKKVIDEKLWQVNEWKELVQQEIDELANCSKVDEYVMMLKGSYNAYDRVMALFKGYDHVELPHATETCKSYTDEVISC